VIYLGCPRGGQKMKKVFQVEVRRAANNANGTHYFTTKKEAETFAIAATAFSGGQYRIQAIFVNEEAVK